MKSIIFCGLILALGMTCNAECKKGECIRNAICKPDTLDDKMVNDLMACKEDFGDKGKEKAAEMYEKCKADCVEEVKTYTKVTEAGNQQFVTFACCPKFHECMKSHYKQSGDKHEMTDDEKQKMKEKFTKMMDCKIKVLGITCPE